MILEKSPGEVKDRNLTGIKKREFAFCARHKSLPNFLIFPLLAVRNEHITPRIISAQPFDGTNLSSSSMMGG
jgi:hypothetical protein